MRICSSITKIALFGFWLDLTKLHLHLRFNVTCKWEETSRCWKGAPLTGRKTFGVEKEHTDTYVNVLPMCFTFEGVSFCFSVSKMKLHELHSIAKVIVFTQKIQIEDFLSFGN